MSEKPLYLRDFFKGSFGKEEWDGTSIVLLMGGATVFGVGWGTEQLGVILVGLGFCAIAVGRAIELRKLNAQTP